MTPLRIDVDASGGHTYPVLLSQGLVARVTETLDSLGVGRRRLVVSTPTLWRLLGSQLSELTGRSEPILMPDGERFKTLATVARMYEGLLRADADRASVVIAIGGGVVGDTAGFAAATFLRGLSLVHVPTTLLAQVDSSIGGKVGVNLAAGKNLVGAFHPPTAVLADPDVLRTLPRREFRSGLYEVVKYAVIASPSLFETLAGRLKTIFARDNDVLVPIIAESCRIKARVVTEDEHEHGLRKILNFGHTAGHALEAITRFKRFRHGEAIAYGMLVAGHLARVRGVFPAADLKSLANLLLKMGPLPSVADLSAAEALAAMRHDKKVLDTCLHYVLPTTIGETAVVSDVTEDELVGALRAVGLTE